MCEEVIGGGEGVRQWEGPAKASEISLSNHYIESLPLMVKDTRSCFSQGKKFTVQLALDCVLALRK